MEPSAMSAAVAGIDPGAGHDPERPGHPHPASPARWCVTVIASRETPDELLTTVESVERACAQPSVIDIIVNGNPGLADAMRRHLAARSRGQAAAVLQTRLWSIGHGDKANAFNLHVHDLWPQTEVTFYLDGYVRPQTAALQLLAQTLRDQPERLAAAAMPTMGRSAAKLRARMEREGGLHGNLFALPGNTMRRLRQAQFRLPVGLYRVDSTIGSFLSLGMEPSRGSWEPLRHIALVHEATWEVPSPGRLWPWLIHAMQRRMRQAVGDFENAAVRHWMHRSGRHPSRWPQTAQGLIAQWWLEAPTEARSLQRSSPLRWWAARSLQANRHGPPEGHESLRVRREPAGERAGPGDGIQSSFARAQVSVCMFAYNEGRFIVQALDAVATCAGEAAVTVHVLINGCTDDTEALVRNYRPQGFDLVPVVLARGDKAHAWNHYVHEVAARQADLHVFTDGDMQMQAGSIRGFLEAFAQNPQAMGCAGLPVSGRSRDTFRHKLITQREMAGNLYALRCDALWAFREKELRLPIGQFGEDGLVTMLLKFDLDPRGTRCDERITHAQAGGFHFPRLSPLKPSDWLIYRNRKRRYAMRRQQAHMLYPALYRQGCCAMPAHVHELYRLHPAGVTVKTFGWIDRWFDSRARRRIEKIALGESSRNPAGSVPLGEDPSLYS